MTPLAFSLLKALADMGLALWHMVVEVTSSNPLIVAGIVALLVIIGMIRRGRRTVTDPTRLFTKGQRDRSSQMAGGQCEMDGWLFYRRCGASGKHADHWIPWAKGGATSDQNLVWACARHNLAKSAHMPTRRQTARIARRRVDYFPSSHLMVPGERWAAILRQQELQTEADLRTMSSKWES